MIKTVRLPILQDSCDQQSLVNRLQLTASFATLDARVADAAANETSLTRQTILTGSAKNFPTLESDPSPTVHLSPNGRVKKAAKAPPIEVRSSLEASHPVIATRIIWTWRSPELLAYLKRLIIDDRCDRVGFGHEAMSELLLLHDILDPPLDVDKWNINARVF